MGTYAPGTAVGAADVIVIGGGLAGTVCSIALGLKGFAVTLVDKFAACPPVFKAEKIEPDHMSLLRRLGLFEGLLPYAGCIRQVGCYYRGRPYKNVQAEQYGLPYSDMVHAFRQQLPRSVRPVTGHVVEITNGSDLQHVRLANGDVLPARLVVIACGLNHQIPAALGLRRKYIQRHQCVALGFNLARLDGESFGFDAITCESINRATGIDYLTLFKFRSTMRANLFAFPGQDLGWVREFAMDSDGEVRRYFPELSGAIGEYRVSPKVETALVDLYQMEGNPPHGVVLIGDAAQNV